MCNNSHILPSRLNGFPPEHFPANPALFVCARRLWPWAFGRWRAYSLFKQARDNTLPSVIVYSPEQLVCRAVNPVINCFKNYFSNLPFPVLFTPSPCAPGVCFFKFIPPDPVLERLK
jgi:hypothetical protein